MERGEPARGGVQADLAPVGPPLQLGGQHVERPDRRRCSHGPAGPVPHGDAPVLLRREQAAAPGEAQPDPHHRLEGGAHPGGRAGGRGHDRPAAVDVHRRRFGVEACNRRNPQPVSDRRAHRPARQAVAPGGEGRSGQHQVRLGFGCGVQGGFQAPFRVGVEGVVAAHQRPHHLGPAVEQERQSPPRTDRPFIGVQGGSGLVLSAYPAEELVEVVDDADGGRGIRFGLLGHLRRSSPPAGCRPPG